MPRRRRGESQSQTQDDHRRNLRREAASTARLQRERDQSGSLRPLAGHGKDTKDRQDQRLDEGAEPDEELSIDRSRRSSLKINQQRSPRGEPVIGQELNPALVSWSSVRAAG